MDFGDFFRTRGGLAGIAALLWRGYDEFGSYLRIRVKVEGPTSGWITILSTIDSKGIRPKDLTWAFLLIGPEDENPITTANILLKASDFNRHILYERSLQVSYFCRGLTTVNTVLDQVFLS